MEKIGSEEARRNFRDLLDDAQQGEATEISRNGRPIAVLVPANWYNAAIGFITISAEDKLPGDWRVLTDSVREARRDAGFPEDAYEEEGGDGHG